MQLIYLSVWCQEHKKTGISKFDRPTGRGRPGA